MGIGFWSVLWSAERSARPDRSPASQFTLDRVCVRCVCAVYQTVTVEELRTARETAWMDRRIWWPIVAIYLSVSWIMCGHGELWMNCDVFLFSFHFSNWQRQVAICFGAILLWYFFSFNCCLLNGSQDEVFYHWTQGVVHPHR